MFCLERNNNIATVFDRTDQLLISVWATRVTLPSSGDTSGQKYSDSGIIFLRHDEQHGDNILAITSDDQFEF